MFDIMGNIAEMMAPCTCLRGEKVMYICLDAKCPNFEKQKLYCVQCADQEENPPHDHRNRTIASQGVGAKVDWRDTRLSIEKIAAKASDWFKLHEGLCRVLEQAFGETEPQS